MINGVNRGINQGIVNESFERPSAEVVEKISRAYSAFVLDHMGKLGVMKRVLPIKSGMKVCGVAVTALGPDLSVRRMAIDLAQEGDVLCVANYGITDYACYGDGTATRMILKGMKGCVIDGATRDVTGLREMNYPTFAIANTPKNYDYPVSKEFGAVNVPVVMGGVVVNPGDIILGDDDGVVVVPREIAAEMSELIVRNLAIENDFRESMTEYEAFDVRQELISRGYEFNK